MKHLLGIMLGIFITLSLITVVSYADENIKIDNEKKETIKAAMKVYVDKKLAENNNVYKIENINGVFDHMHKKVKKEGGSYASCASVKVGKKTYIVIYHVKEENGKYSVVKEVLHKENEEEVNKLLWKKE